MPFRTLKQKITYIQRTGVCIGDMITKEGNRTMRNAIQVVVDYILNEKKINRNKIIEVLTHEWRKVHSKHKEAYDSVICEDVMWYVDSCLEFRGKKEVSRKELNELHEEKTEVKEKKSVFKLIKPIKK